MNKLKILFFIPLILALCGCTSKNYGQLNELDKSIIEDLVKEGIVTSCDCPNVYVRSIYWSTMLLEQKQTVAKIYVKNCQSPIVIKDAHNGRNLMKCNNIEYSAKCKIYE